MHKSHIPNSTYVVFGVLSDAKGVSINPVSLSVLKSSLVELYLQEANLRLTSSTFGVPSSLEIIKFRGSVTVTPRPPAPVSKTVQTLFNFMLNNSIYDVKENLDLLTKQLKTGLRLRFDEVLCFIFLFTCFFCRFWLAITILEINIVNITGLITIC